MEIAARNSKDFNERLLSLKNSKKLCDGDLIVNGERIPVHTVILSASSEYFESIFVESGLKEAIFNGMNTETVLLLIDFFYTGIIKITEKNVEEVLKMANILSIPSIVESCSKILESKLDIDNCLSIWKIGKEGDLKNIKESASKFIQENFEKVCSQKEYLMLQFMDVNELLMLDLSADSEETIFNAVKNWVKYDEDSRKDKLVDLLDHVQLSCLPDIFISESLLLCDSVKCYEKFIKAHQSQYSNIEECIRSSTLIAIGDNEFEFGKKIQIFDSPNQQWIEIDIQCNKKNFSTVLMGEELLLIGGQTPSSTVNNIDKYNLRTGKIDSFPSMKHARYHTSAVQHKGAVYVLGGNNNGNVSNVEKWDPLLKSWTDLAPLSIARYAHEAAILGDEIIVAGGHHTSITSLTEAYNMVTNTWRTCSPMNESRYFFGLAAIKEYLYAVGGHNGGNMKSAERYDSKIDKWTTIASIEIARHALAATKFQGKLVIAGGHSGSRSKIVEIYDEKANKWKPMASLKSGKFVFDLVQIPLSLAKNVLSRSLK